MTIRVLVALLILVPVVASADDTCASNVGRSAATSAPRNAGQTPTANGTNGASNGSTPNTSGTPGTATAGTSSAGVPGGAYAPQTAGSPSAGSGASGSFLKP